MMSSSTNIARRELRFDSLDEVVRDAEHLLAVGYDKTGKWDLGQCCGHLSEWFRYQMEGYPRSPLLLRPVFWFVRNTVAPRLVRKALASGTTKDGMPTIPQSVPSPGEDEARAVATLRDTVARWQAFTGELHPSPLFGMLTKDEWVKGHLIHAAHHLSFLVPKS
jgi:hypothetical protein